MKISTEDFTDETLAIDDTYGDDVREIVVLVMEADYRLWSTFGLEGKGTKLWAGVGIGS